MLVRFGSRALAVVLACLFSGWNARAQEVNKEVFEFPDRVVTIVVPKLIKIEKTEDSGFRLSYNVESYIDPEKYEDRIFLEYTVKYLKPQKFTTAVLEMSPFEKPATLQAWNPDDRAAYVTFDQGNPAVDLNSINYKGAEEKFSGDVQAIMFATLLSQEPGEHVVEIRKFSLE